MSYDLSLVIVSWNVKDLLIECLETITAAIADLAVEVIVVDNASTDGTSAAVRHTFPWVNLVSVAKNRGFAAGNNVGLEASTGQYVMLLNSDTLVPADALKKIVEFMNQTPDAGACGPRLVHPNQRIQAFAFGGDPTLPYLIRRGFNHLLWKRPLHNWQTDQVHKVDWVAGTALLVRQEALENVGLLDENFYAYFEDNDWCLRIRQHGWNIYYNPQVSIIHIGGQSLKKDPAARNAYYNSLEYFYTKHYSYPAKIALRVTLNAYRMLNGL